MAEKLSVFLLGAGNMGGALLTSWAQKQILDTRRSAVVAPNPSDRVLSICEERLLALNPVDDGDGYDICVLAVKPQMFADVLPTLHWPGMHRTIFVSIAAGVTIDTIGSLLKSQVEQPKIVRTMPNLASTVGAGMTLLTAGPNITYRDKEDVAALFNAAGETVWCDTEDRLDRLMGISGCGPAYLFLLCEAMEEAARAEGASAADARSLAQATIEGAALHLAQDGRSAGDLRTAVTSPGGATAAALGVLDDVDVGFRPMVKKAVMAAYDRAKAIGA